MNPVTQDWGGFKELVSRPQPCPGPNLPTHVTPPVRQTHPLCQHTPTVILWVKTSLDISELQQELRTSILQGGVRGGLGGGGTPSPGLWRGGAGRRRRGGSVF